MARCPNCLHHFREPEDEQGMHDCPYCGYGRQNDDPEPDDEQDREEPDGEDVHL